MTLLGPDGLAMQDEGQHPWILSLDVNGAPYRWISWQAACHYHARDLVAWSIGEHSFRFLGGTSRITGERSQITTHSIIAIKGRAQRPGALTKVPPLNNRELFRRDRHLCAYCGHRLPGSQLTRDHVMPVSRGGRDIWMNVVTACRPCNQRKSGRTPEQARMALLYAPYVPNKAEYLILCNRNILADQMDFLTRHLPRQSRLLDVG
ncbi:HNH endonuclease [Azoarcus sp. L1K30]|uniref:HNH endonuclease n=1 Tax=Azoarcus sp. L1K30 TaxID=2820277 RepID=UPI001B82BCAC|nr:HNH endonuclease [Azoarcus sp. L1K30]MBR0564562.1 HNH endonuclease [Azoarcus sp. L1K30]